MRALLLASLLFAACYRPHLGPVPFQCALGGCPRDYRCVEDLCIAAYTPPPPTLIGTTPAGPEPQALWDEARFSVLWQQRSPGPDAGLHLSFLDGGAVDDRLFTDAVGDLAVSTVFHQGVFVSAARINAAPTNPGEVRDLLGVFTLDPAVTAVRKTALTCLVPPSVLGWSAPSLVAGPEASVTLAATYAQVSATSGRQILSDNIFARRVSLPVTTEERYPNAIDPITPCGFVAAPTALRLATEVSVARGNFTEHEEVTFFWRDEQSVHRSLYVDDQPTTGGSDLPPGEILHVPHSVSTADGWALVAQLAPSAGQSVGAWVAMFINRDGSERQRWDLNASAMVPDIALDQERFVTCARGAAGELELRFFDTGFAPVTAAQVPRLSRAEITSCRIAAGRDQIGVAFSERAGTGAERIYFRAVPRP